MKAGSEVAKLAEGILANVKASRSGEPQSWRHPEDDIRHLGRHDYAPSLHELHDQSAVDRVLQSARSIFHEVGHLVAAQVFDDPPQKRVHLFFDADYSRIRMTRRAGNLTISRE